VTRLAVLSYHTSPLAQPGTGDGGGMNVYVRELSSALARLGHEVDVYTRRSAIGEADVVHVEPGFRVHNVTAGPAHEISRDELLANIPIFTRAVATLFRKDGNPDVIHANYWMSGLAGHELKHELNIPLVMTFHTLERVKAAAFIAESDERAIEEGRIFACADAVLASCDIEAEQFAEHYNANPERVHIVPLGVEHAFFAPGYQPQARRALGLHEETDMLLYIGRLQELKGVDLALETLIEMRRRGREVTLAIIGGPSGSGGRETLNRLRERVAQAGVISQVLFVAPQSHQLLSTWMRAASVTLVPSRAESFGLVALESSASGTPVVASKVGGLITLIEDGVTGRLLESRDPVIWADAVSELLDSPELMTMANAAMLFAKSYSWKAAAQSVDDLVHRFEATGLIRC
jgi:D-inositol-3-phosphate glycosyltransferase